MSRLRNGKIRNRTDLLYKLLRTNLEPLTDAKKLEVIDFITETPDTEFTKYRNLRTTTTKFFITNIKHIPEIRKEIARDTLLRVSIIDAQNDFYSYVKMIAPYVIPNEFKDGRHIQVICESLQQLYESYADPDARTDRLQVFLPPRSMKSVLCSIIFPSWVLGRNPTYRILLIGGNVSTAIDVFGRPLKNLISSQEYQGIFPDTKIDKDVKSAQRFNTQHGGGFFCAGAGQGIAGRGGDFIICDDVINEQNAFSKVERTKINLNYVPGIRSRSQPGAAELIINTRWHLDDLSGFTQGMDGYVRPDGTNSKKGCYRPWRIISIPAILDKYSVELLKKPGDPEDIFVPGGSYWPEYKPIEEIEALKANYRSTEPHKWEALYMQNPVPDEGNVVKFSDWKVWTNPKPPQVSQVLVSIDTAFSEKQRADYTAITVWGVFYKTVETSAGTQSIPNLILLYAEKGKWNFHDLCEKCEWLRSESPWKPDYFIIEKKTQGITLARELYRRQFSLFEFDPKGNKEERLQAAAILIKAGRAWVPLEKDSTDLKEWAQEVVDEVCNFPSAPHDDFADTVSMILIWLRDNGTIRHEAYDYEDEDEDEDYYESDGKTYWGSLTRVH